MMDRDKIEKLLVKAIVRGVYKPNEKPFNRVELDRDLYNQTLALIRAKPKMGEFTKMFREIIGRQKVGLKDESSMLNCGERACTLLDASREEKEKLEEAYGIRYGDIQRQERLIEHLTAKINGWEGAILEPLQERYKALGDENVVLNEEKEKLLQTIRNIKKYYIANMPKDMVSEWEQALKELE